MAEHAAVASAIGAIGKNRVSPERNMMTKSRALGIMGSPMKLVHFNISGQDFIISRQLIEKFPNSKLGCPVFLSENWVEDLKVFYFDRDPTLFNTILNLFRYDVLSIPPGYDRRLVREEAKYWNVPLDRLNTGKDREEARLEAEFQWLENRIPPPPPSAKTWVKRRYKAWCFVTDPLGPHTPFRKFSVACCFLTLIFVLLFLILFGMSTSVYYRQPIDGKLDFTSENSTDMDMESATAAIGCLSIDKIDCYLKSSPELWIEYAKRIIMAMFVAETVVRLLLCPGLAYFKSLINWMDIIAGASAIVTFILVLTQPEEVTERSRSRQYTLLFMQSVQVLRVFKIFQYANVIDGLMIMMLTIRACLKELFLLVIYLLLAMFLFSTLIFFAELQANTGSGIPDALHGYWWSIITMTTVGYGDFYPTTTAGYFFGVLCAITGIILTALPVAVIGSNFNVYWEHNKRRRAALIASLNAEVEKQPCAASLKSYSAEDFNECW